MTTPTNPSELFSPFLPATWNVPTEDDRLDVFLVDKLSAISDVVNDKKIGAYTQSVSGFSGNKFTYDTTSKVRNGFQYFIRIPSYPSSGTLTFPPPPNYTSQFALFQAWGSASKPPTTPGSGDYFSFYGLGTPKITFTISDTVITVTTTGLGSGYSGFICVDYVADGQ